MFHLLVYLLRMLTSIGLGQTQELNVSLTQRWWELNYLSYYFMSSIVCISRKLSWTQIYTRLESDSYAHEHPKWGLSKVPSVSHPIQLLILFFTDFFLNLYYYPCIHFTLESEECEMTRSASCL